MLATVQVEKRENLFILISHLNWVKLIKSEKEEKTRKKICFGFCCSADGILEYQN